MRVAASGLIFDARSAPAQQRWTAFTTVTRLADGTLLATFRSGTTRTSPDGHIRVFASTDDGGHWEERYDGYRQTAIDGTAGEMVTLLIAETEPGQLVGSAWWVDRSDPTKPTLNPRTMGFRPSRVLHLRSRDGGRSWGPPRTIDMAPHPGASPTGPLLRLSDGSFAQPYEYWKTEEDPRPAAPAACLRLSPDGGATWPSFAIVARHPENALYYWDQRLATHPERGEHVAMFWTHDPGRNADVDVHVAHGLPDGGTWTAPRPTGLPGQHCQPVALGGDRLLAVYAHRKDPPGIRAVLSHDFGRTWDRSSEIVVYDSAVGTEAAAAGARGDVDYWVAMGEWRFGHPRGVLLPSREVLVVYYAGDRTTSACWARISI